MMYSSLELARHADEEGGWPNFLFGYGLDIVNLPIDVPDHVRQAILRLTSAAQVDMRIVSTHFDRILQGSFNVEE